MPADAALHPQPPDSLFRLTVDQYHEMIDAGILTTDDRVELLEGLLVRKLSKHPPHVGTNRRLSKTFGSRLPPGWRYRSEQPIVLGDSEPEPDGVIARGSDEDDDTSHPRAGEVALVIGVADATPAEDRRVKGRAYARAGLPIYWLVNLVNRQIEVYTDPDPAAVPEPAYRSRAVYAGDAVLPSVLLDGVEIAGLTVEPLLARDVAAR